jgi:hypothetical protein
MDTSTLESAQSEGSGSGEPGSSVVEVLGAGADALADDEADAEVLGAGADALADDEADVEALGSGALSVGDADVLADSDTVALADGVGVPSVANAVGADSSASGAIAAVAAAAAMARRSFMKTSKIRCATSGDTLGRPPRVGRGCGP